MISTSLAVAALAGMLATGSLNASTTWQTDYRTALQLSAAQQKPLVVVIHTGGASQLFQGPTVPPEAVTAVRQSYVGLSVDPSTPEGSQLASLFRMQEGVVISDKTAAVQALRFEGSVTAPQVAPYLTRYAGMTQPPAQTEYVYGQAIAPAQSYIAYPQVVQSQPGFFQQPGPINTLITRPVTNVFNATRGVVIGGCPNGQCR